MVPARHAGQMSQDPGFFHKLPGEQFRSEKGASKSSTDICSRVKFNDGVVGGQGRKGISCRKLACDSQSINTFFCGCKGRNGRTAHGSTVQAVFLVP